jgi:hypothetical protein
VPLSIDREIAKIRINNGQSWLTLALEKIQATSTRQAKPQPLSRRAPQGSSSQRLSKTQMPREV